MAEGELQKILHVEDEPDIRDITRLSLVRVGGFTLESCESGAQALEKAPQFQPDLILIDVMMPGMDGPATLRALREMPELAQTPVVFVTAKARPHEVEEFKELGAIGVITKPFEPMQLPQQLRELWEEHNS